MQTKQMSEITHQHFYRYAKLELSRAERYCLFLSVAVVDLGSLVRSFVARNSVESPPVDHFCDQIEDGIRELVRQSDYVSRFEDNRLGLILVETSKNGLSTVVNRINSFITDFIEGKLSLRFKSSIEVEGASFPEDWKNFNDLLSHFTTNN